MVPDYPVTFYKECHRRLMDWLKNSTDKPKIKV